MGRKGEVMNFEVKFLEQLTRIADALDKQVEQQNRMEELYRRWDASKSSTEASKEAQDGMD